MTTPERDMSREIGELRHKVEALEFQNSYLKKKLSAEEDENEQINLVDVRWFDGYHEQFEVNEVRFSPDLLLLQLSSGENRHIPLRQVRAFSLSEESHFFFEEVTDD